MERIYLYQDQNFIEEKINSEQVFNDLLVQKIEKESFSINEKELEKKNFICTEKAKERLNIISYFISRRIPLLLIGPSGTAKTISSEYAHSISDLKDKKFIKFSMSSNTTQSELLGKFTGDENSLAGISPKKGPYLEAFEEGYTILLDEINLGIQEVLQCIEESLDTNKLSIPISSQGLVTIKRHPDFMLIATENPNKGLFANKRKNLTNKFISKFQPVSFDNLSKEELLEIAKGLEAKFSQKNGKKVKESVLKELVDFHKEMEEFENQKEESITCITVRQIAASVDAFTKNNNIYNTVMILYGAKYKHEEREKIRIILRKYPSLIEDYKLDLSLPINFLTPNCYPTTQLIEAVKSMQFSFSNSRNVLLTGEEGNGTTQLAFWFSEWYLRECCNKENEKKFIFYSFCTEQTSIYDLIGKQKPNEKSGLGKALIQWEDGFLLKGIEKGGVVILDNVDKCPSTVLERLNSLLDKKYDNLNSNQNKNNSKNIKDQFIVNENPEKKEIDIDPNFRLICICNIDRKKNLSPAFMNRLDNIVLENQLNDLKKKENEYKELIKCLLKKKNIKITKNENNQIDDKNSQNDGDNDNFDISQFNFNNMSSLENNSIKDEKIKNKQEDKDNNNDKITLNETNANIGEDFYEEEGSFQDEENEQQNLITNNMEVISFNEPTKEENEKEVKINNANIENYSDSDYKNKDQEESIEIINYLYSKVKTLFKNIYQI